MIAKLSAIELSNMFALIAAEVIVGDRSVGFINLEASLQYKNTLNTIKAERAWKGVE